jgi:hypothetical protein
MIHDSAEDFQPFVRAEGQKICAGVGVIVALDANRSPVMGMVWVGHGVFKIYSESPNRAMGARRGAVARGRAGRGRGTADHGQNQYHKKIAVPAGARGAVGARRIIGGINIMRQSAVPVRGWARGNVGERRIVPAG